MIQFLVMMMVVGGIGFLCAPAIVWIALFLNSNH